MALVLLPLVLTITSPMWSPDAGFLLAGWVPWAVALVSAIILGTAFDIDVGASSASPVKTWNKLSAILLTATGIVGLCMTLFLSILASALSGGIGL